jgi:hypothetical protein
MSEKLPSIIFTVVTLGMAGGKLLNTALKMKAAGSSETSVIY